MFLALCAVAILLSVPLLDGRLALLAGLRLRVVWLLWLALVVQVVITELPDGLPDPARAGLHLLSYAGAAAFVWTNRAVAGVPLLALGAGLNAVAIAANGGTLPASRSALRAAGIEPAAGFANSGALAHPRLAWLGDTMATPSWLPLRNVVSIGDLVILGGAAVLVHVTCATALHRRRRGWIDAVDRPDTQYAYSVGVRAHGSAGARC